MTFPVHGLLGGGISAAVAKYLRAPKWAQNIAGLFGFLMGMAPDVVDWILWALGIFPRWFIYSILHHDPPWWMNIWPPFWLHRAMDSLIHLYSGFNWWPQFWYFEVQAWLFAFLFIHYVWWGDLTRLWKWALATIAKFLRRNSNG